MRLQVEKDEREAFRLGSRRTERVVDEPRQPREVDRSLVYVEVLPVGRAPAARDTGCFVFFVSWGYFLRGFGAW